MSQILNPRDMRALNEVLVVLGEDTHVRCRKEDMTILVFEGRIPMPLLAAVQKMIEMPDATPEERVQLLGSEQGTQLVNAMRQHACRVVIEPVVVMEDDGNPDHLPASYFTVADLTTIWNATAIVPGMGASAAARFRRGPSPTPPPDGPTGPSVPDTPEPVVTGIERLVSV